MTQEKLENKIVHSQHFKYVSDMLAACSSASIVSHN